jgi:NAD(P)-dependent dehydrogenase (short-subunit alcohol dehydrogenase family)
LDNPSSIQYAFTPEEWESCLKVLTALKDNPFENPDNQRFKTLITAIHKKAKKQVSLDKLEETQRIDHEKLKQTTIIQQAQSNTSSYTHHTDQRTDYSQLNRPQTCYVCHNSYHLVHFFYHKLCPECAEINYGYRQLNPDFKDFQVVITGGRVKIGYATTLQFLRSGAKVLATSRFPAAALEQFSQEPDFEVWKENLTLYGLDLRNIKAVYQFTDYCKTHLPSIDILVNNAAQTIKYPAEYYLPLVQKERDNLLLFRASNLIENATPIALLPAQLLDATASAFVADVQLNRFGQPVDFREKNSWNATLGEIGLEELLEVNLINHIAPYLLISELSRLLKQNIRKQGFIINVTSSEGQFSYANKTIFHPHTNMTKAALNMLTRTSAAEYAKKNIYMNAVDVGWVSTGAHETKRKRLFERLSIPPLDSVDGAMRIIHPILEVQKGDTSLYGKLLKNYGVVAW